MAGFATGFRYTLGQGFRSAPGRGIQVGGEENFSTLLIAMIKTIIRQYPARDFGFTPHPLQGRYIFAAFLCHALAMKQRVHQFHSPQANGLQSGQTNHGEAEKKTPEFIFRRLKHVEQSL